MRVLSYTIKYVYYEYQPTTCLPKITGFTVFMFHNLVDFSTIYLHVLSYYTIYKTYNNILFKLTFPVQRV